MKDLYEEGKKYLKEGLPEERLASILKKPMLLVEVRKKVPDFTIGLSWAKKNGWIKIEKGKLSLVKIPSKIEIKEALKKIESGKNVKNY